MVYLMSDTLEVPRWTVGDRLRKARTWAGVSAEEMAGEIGRTVRTVHNYESDSTATPLLVLKVYALRTGIPYEWLKSGDIAPDTSGYPAFLVGSAA